MSFIEGTDRSQVSLLPPCVDDYVAPDALVRVVDAFVSSLNLGELGFGRTVAAATGRPGYITGTQASCSRRIAMICSSVNLDRFIRPSPSWGGL